MLFDFGRTSLARICTFVHQILFSIPSEDYIIRACGQIYEIPLVAFLRRHKISRNDLQSLSLSIGRTYFGAVYFKFN